MFRMTIKELMAKKLRLLSTAMAVLLGVAFLAGTLILTDTATKSFDNVLADANAGTDAYVRGVSPLSLSFGDQRPRIDAALADKLRNVDGVADVASKVNGYAQIVDKHGKPIGDAAQVPLLGSNWVRVAELNPYSIAAGHAPKAADEIAIDKNSADTAGYKVGDRASVLTTGAAAHVHHLRHREVRRRRLRGRCNVGALHRRHRAGRARVTRARWTASRSPRSRGVSQAVLAKRIAEVAGNDVQVVTGAKLVAEDQKALHDNISSFSDLHADLRRHRDVRRCVHHQQHVLDHGGAAHQGDGDAAVDRCESSTGDALGDRGGRRGGVGRLGAGSSRRHGRGDAPQGDARLDGHGHAER